MLLPPTLFVARAMVLAVVGGAQGHSEFITDLYPETPRLRMSHVVRVGWLATADEAGLLRHKAEMLL